jgi:pyrimidine-nucleoside phosphorylase
MRAVDVIRKKRDGLPLDRDEVAYFVRAAADGLWPDYQLAALLMAIWIRGMTADETAWLTRAMADSGTCLDLSDLPGPVVDKHSTGGVGDKTSLVLGPLAAACGVYVPMMSGRGLGHTGGTLDKLESIPGFRVDLSLDEFHTVLRATGIALIGQSAVIAPADKKLYALRDVTGTVESIPLITASILSKKIAEGAKGLVMDVKIGRGAFMKDEASARKLAAGLVALGAANGLATEAMLTSMDAPLGAAVGNAIEVAECIDTLRGEGPADVTELSVELAARMVRLGGLAATDAQARAKVKAALASGAGLQKFREVIEKQGGDPGVCDDPRRLPVAPHRVPFAADRDGYVTAVDAEQVGLASMALGAGREQAHEKVDPGVGIMVRKRVGDEVEEGDVLAELIVREAGRVSAAAGRLKQAFRIGDAAPTRRPLVIDSIPAAKP